MKSKTSKHAVPPPQPKPVEPPPPVSHALTITLSHHEAVNAASNQLNPAAQLLKRANELFNPVSYNSQNSAPTIYHFTYR